MNKSAMLVNPKFFGRNFQIEQSLVFILSPFKEPYNQIFEDHIKIALEKFGLVCKRADNIFTPHQIIEDIWQQINSSRFIIADVTEKNPNVFYEMGIAHTIGKEVIIITQSKEDVPFDIQNLRYIEYTYTPPGMRKFEEILELYVKNLLRGENAVDQDIIEAATLLKRHYAKWQKFDLLPTFEIFKEITAFAEHIRGQMSQDELSFILKCAIWYGQDLVFWAKCNKQNDKCINVLVETFIRPERRPFFRAGYVIEFLDKEIQNSLLSNLKKKDLPDPKLLNLIIDKALRKESLQFWEKELPKIIGKERARELIIQANTSKQLH